MTQLDRLLYDLRQSGVGGEYLDDLEYIKALRSDMQNPSGSQFIQQKEMSSNQDFSLFLFLHKVFRSLHQLMRH